MVGLKTREGTELGDFCLARPQTDLASVVGWLQGELEVVRRGEVRGRKVPRLSDFEVVKTIGVGGFSKVFEVRKKDTGKIYAMKVMSKSFILSKDKAAQVMTEKSILVKANHPFIVKLHYCFHTVSV